MSETAVAAKNAKGYHFRTGIEFVSTGIVICAALVIAVLHALVIAVSMGHPTLKDEEYNLLDTSFLLIEGIRLVFYVITAFVVGKFFINYKVILIIYGVFFGFICLGYTALCSAAIVFDAPRIEKVYYRMQYIYFNAEIIATYLVPYALYILIGVHYLMSRKKKSLSTASAS